MRQILVKTTSSLYQTYSHSAKRFNGGAVSGPTTCTRPGATGTNARVSWLCTCAGLETAGLLDEPHDFADTLAAQEIGEDEVPCAAGLFGVSLHHGEIDADIRGEVSLVDDQQIGAGDGGPALARDLFALADTDHIKGEISKIGGEGRGRIVANGFEEQYLEIRMKASELVDGRQVVRGILADGRVRASTCLDADDAVLGQSLGARQDQRFLAAVYVVRYNG